MRSQGTFFKVEEKYSGLVLGEEVGKGVHGIVHRATWDGRNVAVKCINVPQPKKQERAEKYKYIYNKFMADFEYEQKVLHKLAPLKLPKVLNLLGGFWATPSQYQYVHPLMQKGSLGALLKKQDIYLQSWRHRRKIMCDIATGVAALHQYIIHRDLKPDNILIDENWHAYVADFGFAFFKDKYPGGSAKGSPIWTAPEVFFENVVPTQAADVYALALILWELCTQQGAPHSTLNFSSLDEFIMFVQKNRPPIPDKISQPYPNIIRHAWAQDPAKRATAQQMLDELSSNEAIKTATEIDLMTPQETDLPLSEQIGKGWQAPSSLDT